MLFSKLYDCMNDNPIFTSILGGWLCIGIFGVYLYFSVQAEAERKETQAELAAEKYRRAVTLCTELHVLNERCELRFEPDLLTLEVEYNGHFAIADSVQYIAEDREQMCDIVAEQLPVEKRRLAFAAEELLTLSTAWKPSEQAPPCRPLEEPESTNGLVHGFISVHGF